MFAGWMAPIERSTGNQGLVILAYAVVVLCAVILVFSPASYLVTGDAVVLTLTLVDVVAVVGFKMSAPGAYLPLLVMGLLPLTVAIGVSWRPAAATLALIFVVFTAELWLDSAIRTRLGQAGIWLLVAMYAFVCGARMVVAAVRPRYEDEIARIMASREELLADIMTASESQRRQISEFIHDGALQNVLAARRDIADFLKTTPAAPLERAATNLHDASKQLRDATFELHPSVLEQAGLGAAVEKLASLTSERSGISITAIVDYPQPNAIDPMVFGVARELLSNVVRHSRATAASLRLTVVDQRCCLDVIDNGIGIDRDAAARRLAEGHIGLASHRARVEAAGGSMSIVDEPVGAHICMKLPLQSNRPASLSIRPSRRDSTASSAG
ncbi:hypothetical protein A5641_10305 [Mycobacterium sp. 1554424.7]|nr:hypothetical protein A5641_10305 [Mycobacterium sp. 1554424.7]